MSQPPERGKQKQRPFIRRRVAVVFCLLFVVAGAVIWKLSKPPFSGDSNFTRTTRPTGSFASGSGIVSKAYWKLHEVKARIWPNPMTYSFGARAEPVSCSIHGLLNQCMTIGGTEYLIEKGVSAGSVMFGPTNVLNGKQWIEAFEAALQTNKPEWHDFRRKEFRKENLVLLRHNKRTVLVLSKETAEEYQLRYPRLKRVTIE